MDTLPDYLRSNLKVVFVGTNPGKFSTGKGHYFAIPGNPFWKLLHDAGLVTVRLSFKDDTKLLDFGYGLTDLVKKPTTSIKDLTEEDYQKGISAFRRKITGYAPKIICFVGMDAFRRYFRIKGKVNYGLQSLRMTSSRVFVVPSMSGKARIMYDDRLKSLKELCDELSRPAI